MSCLPCVTRAPSQIPIPSSQTPPYPLLLAPLDGVWFIVDLLLLVPPWALNLRDENLDPSPAVRSFSSCLVDPWPVRPPVGVSSPGLSLAPTPCGHGGLRHCALAVGRTTASAATSLPLVRGGTTALAIVIRCRTAALRGRSVYPLTTEGFHPSASAPHHPSRKQDRVPFSVAAPPQPPPSLPSSPLSKSPPKLSISSAN